MHSQYGSELVKYLDELYRWRFVGGAVRRQTGLSTEVLRFIQHLFYRFCDFIIGELDFSVSEWVIDTISILTHQIWAPA